MEKVSVSPSESLAIGENAYDWPCITKVAGDPTIVGGLFPDGWGATFDEAPDSPPLLQDAPKHARSTRPPTPMVPDFRVSKRPLKRLFIVLDIIISKS